MIKGIFLFFFSFGLVLLKVSCLVFASCVHACASRVSTMKDENFSTKMICSLKKLLSGLSTDYFFYYHSILDYELLDVEIPTISLVGYLIKSGIRVLVYR